VIDVSHHNLLVQHTLDASDTRAAGALSRSPWLRPSGAVYTPVGYHPLAIILAAFHNLLSGIALPYPTSDNQDYVKFNRNYQKGQQLPKMTEDEARAHIEKIRWPDGPFCPHCASVNVYRMQGESIRNGLLACRDCRGHFTVTVGTVMEDSHLPLETWVRAFHLMASSKKGISALQLQRNLGIGSYRTAWHLAHRIREAMKCEPTTQKLTGEVQADETYIGGKPRKRAGQDVPTIKAEKTPIVAMVQTDGNVRSTVVERVNANTLHRAL
jgi:transposase-like protein